MEKLAETKTLRTAPSGGGIAAGNDPCKMGVVLGLPFHAVTMDEALGECAAIIERGEPAHMVTANLDFTRLASLDRWLRNFIFHSHRVLCDGFPLVWLSKFFKGEVPERVAGSDLVPRLLELSSKRGYRVYFLGSDEKTLGEVREKLREEMPGLNVVGAHAPPFGPVHSWDNEKIVRELKESRADIVLVAVGCPKQERWIATYQEDSGVPLGIGVGASLDFITGKQVRAPKWMQRIGLEWFWRMVRNPVRLGGRYAKDFGFLVKATLSQWWATRGTDRSVRESYRAGAGEVVIKYGDEVPQVFEGMLVCDCASLARVRGSELGVLAGYMREAKRKGVGFVVANAPKGLVRFVETFGLQDEFTLLGAPAKKIAPPKVQAPGERNSKVASVGWLR